MRKVFTVRKLAVFGMVVGAVFLLGGEKRSQARPNYLKAFMAKYPALQSQAKKVKCNVCHFSKKKKNRNDYGKALAKALGKKKVKKAPEVTVGLVKVEKVEKSKGVTFGSLLKAGKLPGTAPKKAAK